jgi:hypothetical protein
MAPVEQAGVAGGGHLGAANVASAAGGGNRLTVELTSCAVCVRFFLASHVI